MGPSILLDDSALATNFNYLGTQWTRQTGDNSVLNGTLTICNPANQSQNIVPTKPSLSIFFWGSGISFYGNMTNNLAANYTIDQTSLRPVPFPTGISNGKTGINIFSLPNLTNSLSHSINIFPVAGLFALDYVTYVPNADTALTAAKLILDDADPELQYGNGQWNHTTGDFQQGRPYNGTMTGTNTKGATMQLTFVGSSVTVYGLLNRVDGRLSASFMVDGQNSTGSSFKPFDGEQEDTDSSRWMLSQQFFHQDLTPGQHTLQMMLVDISGPQKLWIDSVVFEGTSATKLTSSGSTSGTGGLDPIGGTSSSGLSKAAIGGIAAAAFFIAIFLLGYARRKWSNTSTKRSYTNNYVPPPPPAPAPPPVTSMYNGPNNSYSPYNSYAPAPTHPNQYDYNRPYGYSDRSPPPVPPSAAVPPPPPKTTTTPARSSTAPTSMPTPDLSGSDGSAAAASYARPPLRPMDGSAAGTTASESTSDQRAESYYTYSSKADLIGLEWGVRPEDGSRVNIGGDGAALKMPVPSAGPVVVSQGKTALGEKAGYGNLGSGGGAAHEDGAGDASQVQVRAVVPVGAVQRGDGHGAPPSNHGHEDGRDVEEEQPVVAPQRERDAGPADFPPAYDDTLYGHQ